MNVSFSVLYFQLRKLAYAINKSATILLPRWKEILEDLAAIAATTDKQPLSIRIMPPDVKTRWESTHDMLKFAYAYREAIDRITGDRAMNLRDCELSDNEWETVKQLCDSLNFSEGQYPHLFTVIIALILN